MEVGLPVEVKSVVAAEAVVVVVVGVRLPYTKKKPTLLIQEEETL